MSMSTIHQTRYKCMVANKQGWTYKQRSVDSHVASKQKLPFKSFLCSCSVFVQPTNQA